MSLNCPSVESTGFINLPIIPIVKGSYCMTDSREEICDKEMNVFDLNCKVYFKDCHARVTK